MTKVLVTGFGPFLDNRANPSEVIARAIDGHRAHGVRFVAHAPLPVVYGAAARSALHAAREIGADAIVALGLAAKSERVRVEGFARNACTSAHEDASGARRCRSIIVRGAPHVLPTPFDRVHVTHALGAAGIAHELSSDAGGYVCNDLYYRLLAAGMPALFVHVPAHASVHWARPLALGFARAVRARLG